MPKHIDGYLSKEVAELKGDASILDCAQTLHEFVTGASDVSDEEADKCFEVVNFYIEHWVPSHVKYDQSVFNLLEQAVVEYRLKIREIGRTRFSVR